jgi:choline kinase
MKGIILAAGKGSRLNGNDADTPKCLVTVGGLTLIERQVRALRANGIDEVIVVVGCGADRVRRMRDMNAQFVENTRYADTNSLYSLWLAREHLVNGFVVMNCDVLFHPQLLTDLLQARYPDALLVAYHEPDEEPYGAEEMKVKVRGGLVADISKQLPPDEADAENLGVVKFGAAGARLLIDVLDRLVADGRLREWAPRAFQEFARHRPLRAIDTRGLPWIEIDFPEDYRRAVAEVLPRIEAESDRWWTPSLAPPQTVDAAARGMR